MKGRLALILLVFAGVLAARSPLWQQIKKASWKGADLYYILDEKRTTFFENGSAVNRFHQIVKVLTWKGARKLSVLTFPYDPATSGVEVEDVRIWRREGRIERVDLRKLSDQPSPARIVFWGHRHKVLPLPSLRPGDAVQIRYRTWGYRIAYLGELPPPPLEGHFYDIVYFSSRYPTARKVYLLSGPRHIQLSYEVYNGTVKVSKYYRGDRAYYRWERRNIPPLKKEPLMPAFSDVAVKLVVSSLHDWRVKSRWFFRVAEPSLKPDSKLKEKVKEIIGGRKEQEEIISALTHWVAQNVRYLGLSLGKQEGYTPHPASYTLRLLAGVCKDKAALLTAMLRIAGFAAFPVMTMAGARVERVVADQFNHSVTAIRIGPHRFRLLDPTWAPDSRELWSTREQLQYYLVGTPEGEDLMRTPPVEPRVNYLRMKLRASAEEQDLVGELSLEADNHYDTYLRRSINPLPSYRRTSIFYQLLYDISPSARLRSLKFSDPLDFSRPFRARLRFKIKDFILKRGRRLLLFSPLARLPLRRFHEFLSLSLKGKREHPVKFRNTRLIQLVEEITLPRGFVLRALPEPVKVDCPCASLSAKYDYKRRRFRAKYRIELRKILVEGKEMEELKRFLEGVRGLALKYAIFERAGGR